MIKKYFYKIYEKILGKFDDNDGKLFRQYYKKRFGVEVGKHSYGMDFSNIAQGTKIGAFLFYCLMCENWIDESSNAVCFYQSFFIL